MQIQIKCLSICQVVILSTLNKEHNSWLQEWFSPQSSNQIWHAQRRHLFCCCLLSTFVNLTIQPLVVLLHEYFD